MVLIYLLGGEIQILYLHRSILLRRRLLFDPVHFLGDDASHVIGPNKLIQISLVDFVGVRVCRRVARHFRRIFRLPLRQVFDEYGADVGLEGRIIIEHNRALRVLWLVI